MARFLLVLASVAIALAVPACGLTLDYGPPDDAGMDVGPRDAALDDAEPSAGADADVDAALEGDASDASVDAPFDLDARPPCVSNTDCDAGSCVHPCDGTGGYCVPTDEVCPAVEVCGCDGMIYPSSCDAHRAGVEVALDGTACPELCSPSTCAGGFCVSCPGRRAVCERALPACRDSPVCGCDGLTYIGDCDAIAHGVAEYTRGACLGDCVSSLDCEPGSYCERPWCDALFGTCQRLPTVIEAYVCGCSGRRYVDSYRALLREGHLGACDGCPIPASDCCADSADCGPTAACVLPDPAVGSCTPSGTCVALTEILDAETCWTEADCGPGAICSEAGICACGFACLLPDAPGRCLSP